MSIVFDPVVFLRCVEDRRWPQFVAILFFASLVGVGVLVTKMALYIPAEDLSPTVFGYLIGLLISNTVASLLSLGLTIVFFWSLMWLQRDRAPYQRVLCRALASLVPAHIITVLVKSIVVVLAPADMPLSKLASVTSLASFFDAPPTYMEVLDPFLLWAGLLLAISHRTLTAGKRSWLASALAGLAPVVLVRLM